MGSIFVNRETQVVTVGRPIHVVLAVPFALIAHRGASGYRPEHTLAVVRAGRPPGRRLHRAGSRDHQDGVLVARHEPEICGTTDVADRPEFARAARRPRTSTASRPPAGSPRTSRSPSSRRCARVERIPRLRPQNTAYDGRFEVPTLEEVLDLRERLSRELGPRDRRLPGDQAPDLLPRARAAARGAARRRAAAQRARPRRRAGVRAVVRGRATCGAARAASCGCRWCSSSAAAARPYDLVVAGDPRTYADLATPAGLPGIAAYADGIGPAKATSSRATPPALAAADDVRRRRPRRGPAGAPVHVPGGEHLPAARAALVGGPRASTATSLRRCGSSSRSASTACSPTTLTGWSPLSTEDWSLGQPRSGTVGAATAMERSPASVTTEERDSAPRRRTRQDAAAGLARRRPDRRLGARAAAQRRQPRARAGAASRNRCTARQRAVRGPVRLRPARRPDPHRDRRPRHGRAGDLPRARAAAARPGGDHGAPGRLPRHATASTARRPARRSLAAPSSPTRCAAGLRRRRRRGDRQPGLSTDADHDAAAQRIRTAVEGLGTAEEAIFAALLAYERNTGLVAQLKLRYSALYGEDLRARLVDELTADEFANAAYLMGEAALEQTELSPAAGGSASSRVMATLTFTDTTRRPEPGPLPLSRRRLLRPGADDGPDAHARRDRHPSASSRLRPVPGRAAHPEPVLGGPARAARRRRRGGSTTWPRSSA